MTVARGSTLVVAPLRRYYLSIKGKTPMNFESTPIYAYFSKFTTPDVLGRSVPSSEFRRGINSGNRPWFVSIAAGARAEKRRKSGYLNARGSTDISPRISDAKLTLPLFLEDNGKHQDHNGRGLLEM